MSQTLEGENSLIVDLRKFCEKQMKSLGCNVGSEKPASDPQKVDTIRNVARSTTKGKKCRVSLDLLVIVTTSLNFPKLHSTYQTY